MRKWRIFLVVAGVLLISSRLQAEVPLKISFQGVLRDNAGQLVSGNVDLRFSIYDLPTGGTALWAESTMLAVDNGIVAWLLGQNEPLPSDLFEGETVPLFLEIRIEDELSAERIEFASTPYAFRVGTIDRAEGGRVIGPIEIANDASPTAQVLSIGTTIDRATLSGYVPIRFVVQDLEALDIDVTGNVGVGTSSPGAKLDVHRDVFAPIPMLRVSAGTGDVGRYTAYCSSIPYLDVFEEVSQVESAVETPLWRFGSELPFISGDRRFSIVDAVAGQPRFLIDATGNVGIGTDSPQAKVDIAGILRTFGFQLPTGAGNGLVLTSDGSGNASWQSAPAPTNVVNLQSSTPGTAQTGHLNIDGTGRFGHVEIIASGSLTADAATIGNINTSSIGGSGGDVLIVDAQPSIQPSTDIPSIVIRQTSAASPTANIAQVQNSSGSQIHFWVDASGIVHWLGTARGEGIALKPAGSANPPWRIVPEEPTPGTSELLITDDVINQLFASMTSSGTLKALCVGELTISDLLPADPPDQPTIAVGNATGGSSICVVKDADRAACFEWVHPDDKLRIGPYKPLFAPLIIDLDGKVNVTSRLDCKGGTFTSSLPVEPLLTFRSASGQIAPLCDWRNDADVQMAKMDPDGDFMCNSLDATGPASFSSTGSCAGSWTFDAPTSCNDDLVCNADVTLGDNSADLVTCNATMGVGTSTPSTALHIKAGPNAVTIENGTNPVDTKKWCMGVQIADGAATLKTADDAFSTLTTRLTVSRSGDVSVIGSGGSGGSVVLSTDALVTSGTLRAFGGGSLSADAGGGGGGGRIVVQATADGGNVTFAPAPGGSVVTLGDDLTNGSTQIVNNFGVGTVPGAFRADIAGDCHATAFPTSSDERLKTNVEPLTNVVDRLRGIRGVTFDWNETYEKLGRSNERRQIGVIAQEVERVFPELVTTWGEENYRAVDYGRLSAVLIEAVKEQQSQIEQLTARVEQLEKKNSRAAVEPRGQ